MSLRLSEFEFIRPRMKREKEPIKPEGKKQKKTQNPRVLKVLQSQLSTTRDKK